MYVYRNLEPILRKVAGQSPVLTIMGPRQSGKTTLAKRVFHNHEYISLEPLDERTFASEDPRGFLKRFSEGAIIDEVQHVPELLSYLQTIVDDGPVCGRWILTGSQNFALLEKVSQSLAGRTSLHTLLPLCWEEAIRFPKYPNNLEQALYTGGFPRIFDQGRSPTSWLGDYIDTYIKRDVRSLNNIGNLATFHRFLQLCAGRSGSLLNYSNLASDSGISQSTAKRWISVLEASYILVCIYAFHGNPRKRVTKMPKLYFLDTGLMCQLLGIRRADQIYSHPLRGQIFETWIATEIIKTRSNLGIHDGIHFYRDHNSIEVDFVIPDEPSILLVEVKSTSTPSSSLWRRSRRVKKHFKDLSKPVNSFIAYAGDAIHEHKDGTIVPWQNLNSLWQPPSLHETDDETAISVSANSQPLPGVEVFALFPNKTCVDAVTDEHGVARLKLHSVEKPMKIYAASIGFAANLEIDWVPRERKLHLELCPMDYGGSQIIKKGIGAIPGMSGTLKPILDKKNRTYIYTDNIAINGGEQEPVDFEFGKTMHLMDAYGQERNIRIIDITGKVALLEYQPVKR